MEIPKSLMITENTVIENVVEKLLLNEFEIISICTTKQKGIDIHAKKQEIELMIEAKGGTTSMNTKRKGLAFTGAQVTDHVGAAILKALKLKSSYPNVRIGIALPADINHLKEINKVKSSLKFLDIDLFWSDGINVTVESTYNYR